MQGAVAGGVESADELGERDLPRTRHRLEEGDCSCSEADARDARVRMSGLVSRCSKCRLPEFFPP